MLVLNLKAHELDPSLPTRLLDPRDPTWRAAVNADGVDGLAKRASVTQGNVTTLLGCDCGLLEEVVAGHLDPQPLSDSTHRAVVLLGGCVGIGCNPCALRGFVCLPAHGATFRLFGKLRSLRAWLSATRAARSTGLGGGGGTEPVRK